MSHRASEWAWRQPVPTAGVRVTLLALADHADRHGFCFPSVRSVVELTGHSRATVQRHLTQLEEDGLLDREARFEDGRQTSNAYQLRLDVDGSQDEAPGPHGEAGEGRTDEADGGLTDEARRTVTRNRQKEPSDVDLLWQHVVEVCRPANVQLTASRSRVLVRALAEAPLDLCKRAVYGLDEYVKRTGKGKRDIARIFVTRPGGSALADQIEWWATQSSTHQPQRHRNLPPHVRDGLITARDHPTSRWVATLNGGLDGRWLTDDDAINAAYDRAVAFALERFGLRVVWREAPGEGYVRLEFQEVTR